MNHRLGRASRWTLAFGMATVLVLTLPASGLAADTLDQTIAAGTVPNQVNSNKLMAQTFTAGMTGQIDKVSLALESHSAFTTATGWLEIRTVDAAGQPNGGTNWPTGLVPIQFAYAFGNPYHDFTISPAFPVTSGTKYAIVWTAKIGTGFWWGNNFSTYGGGQQWLSCQGCAWSASPTKDLAFQTWVGTAAANQPPAVAADHPSVSVTEGTAAGNTGTYADPDGDATTLTASSGSITKTGTGSGTWSWHAPASDEAGSHTITITADDGNGTPSTTSFSVAITAVAPTATATAPATGPEGTAVSLTGTATSPSAEDNAAGFTYGWSVTKNGIAYASGSGAHWRFTPNDNGTYVATMKATDDGNMSDTSSATVNVFNVAPTATITTAGGTTLLVRTPEQSLDFTGTWSDPGTADTHTYQWLFGDGTSSAALNTTHSYAQAGTYHVTLNVRDDDGGVGTDTATVLVQSPQQALTTLETTVNGIATLNQGQKNSLIAKLEAASAAAARGNNTASHNQMSAFLNELRADANTGKITAGQVSALTDAIHAIEAALGTYNRILQWWPLEP